jgi:hypothetical protein
MNCLICNNPVNQLDPNNRDFTEPIPWSEMYDDGTVDLVIPGYGSKRDGQWLCIALCDKCIDEKTLQGVIKEVAQRDKERYNTLKQLICKR